MTIKQIAPVIYVYRTRTIYIYIYPSCLCLLIMKHSPSWGQTRCECLQVLWRQSSSLSLSLPLPVSLSLSLPLNFLHCLLIYWRRQWPHKLGNLTANWAGQFEQSGSRLIAMNGSAVPGYSFSLKNLRSHK